MAHEAALRADCSKPCSHFWMRLTVQPRPKHHFPTKAESALKAHVWEMNFFQNFRPHHAGYYTSVSFENQSLLNNKLTSQMMVRSYSNRNARETLRPSFLHDSNQLLEYGITGSLLFQFCQGRVTAWCSNARSCSYTPMRTLLCHFQWPGRSRCLQIPVLVQPLTVHQLQGLPSPWHINQLEVIPL